MPGTVHLNIPSFRGINQSAGDNSDMGWAAWAENFDTRFGRLTTGKGYRRASIDIGEPIITLARFYRRNYADVNARDLLVAASATSIYVRNEKDETSPWQTIYTGATSGDWSTAVYEKLRNPEDIDPTDVLLMTNTSDGMIALWGSDLTTTVISTPGKFGVLSRYKERMFATGNPLQPDYIYWSEAFDPTMWERNPTDPEAGAGFLDQPTFDGDEFVAMVPFANSLLCFKQDTAYLINGGDPSEFLPREAMGTPGPVAPKSVVSTSNAVIYMAGDGLALYDGSAMRLLSRDALASLVKDIDGEKLDMCQAALTDNIYRVAIPLKGGDGLNAIIEYDIERNVFMLRTGFSIGALLRGEGHMLLTTSKNPDRICSWGEGDTYDGDLIHCVWQSPWTDMGAKNELKSAFRLRAQVEANDLTTKLGFSVQTERKVKNKEIKTADIHLIKRKMISKPVSNKGRLFRFFIRNVQGKPFTTVGGIQLEMDMDRD